MLWSIFAQTGVALKLTANRRFVDTDLVCDGALRQTRFLQRINLVTITLSEAAIGSHSCSFTLDGQRHLGIAASCIIPWVKLHCRVESAVHFIQCQWPGHQRGTFYRTIGRAGLDFILHKPRRGAGPMGGFSAVNIDASVVD